MNAKVVYCNSSKGVHTKTNLHTFFKILRGGFWTYRAKYKDLYYIT